VESNGFCVGFIWSSLITSPDDRKPASDSNGEGTLTSQTVASDDSIPGQGRSESRRATLLDTSSAAILARLIKPTKVFP